MPVHNPEASVVGFLGVNVMWKYRSLLSKSFCFK